MNTKALLSDLQLTVDTLKEAIELIKDGLSKDSAVQFLHGNSNLLRSIIYCLDHGGYDND